MARGITAEEEDDDRSRDGGQPARGPRALRLHHQRGAARHRPRPGQLLVGRRQGRRRSHPRNQELLARRDELQAQLDKWHRQRAIGPHDADEYKQFLVDIGYLQPDPGDFTITTTGVDDEITTTAGPQLVVPILNARFALNAANARWGSLYDALYGTDVISEDDGAEKGSGYNRVRGDKVIAYAREFLDGAVPLASGSYSDATGFKVDDGQVLITLGDDLSTGLAAPEQFVGYLGEADRPSAILLRHNGLHIEILIDPDSPVGSTDKAGVKDVVLESAVTTIMDFEDSVAAVDAEDKVLGYRNWLGSTAVTSKKRSARAVRPSPASSTRTAPTPARTVAS